MILIRRRSGGDPVEPVAHLAHGLLGVVGEGLAVSGVGYPARRVVVGERARDDDVGARARGQAASEGDRVLGSR